MVGLCCSSWQCAHLEHPAGNRKAFAPRALFKYAGGNLPSGSEADLLEQRGVVIAHTPDAQADRISTHQPGGIGPQDHPAQFVRIGFAFAKPGGPFFPRQNDGHTVMNGATELVGERL